MIDERADGVSEAAQALRGVSLFKRLNSDQLSRLAELATRRSYGASDVIVKQGDTSMSFYVILAGSVRIQREGEAGSQLNIVDLGPGGFFGEMGLIDDLPRAATVVALEPTTCALLVKWDFENELRRDPDIALALILELNSRIRQLESRLVKS